MPLTRRAALRTVLSAGATALAAQETAIRIAGRPVEITLTSISPETVRITAQSIENGQVQPIPTDGALLRESWGEPVVRLRALAGSQTVKCGDLTLHLSAAQLTVRVEAKGGRLVQELQADATSGGLTFRLGEGPVLGLGQGGPQFDRRGNLDRMGSGQGAYRLATNGAKVPIQFAIGLSGWALFIHQPLGAFDLTGDAGQLQPPNPQAALPLDAFVIGAKDPLRVMAEYAKITGLPEMAPLWSFGYQQSHRTLGPPEEIIQEAKLFREKKLPCDAMIYLGTEFCPNGWNTRNGEFD